MQVELTPEWIERVVDNSFTDYMALPLHNRSFKESVRKALAREAKVTKVYTVRVSHREGNFTGPSAFGLKQYLSSGTHFVDELWDITVEEVTE